jgi:1-deoxy-D-xylulose-5-phosphate reductoisomerase
MRLPIQYALTYPQRLKTDLKDLDFFTLKSLNFEKPNFAKFPALELAFFAGRKGGTLPCVLNAADEIAVDAFLAGDLPFIRIIEVVEKVTMKHKSVDHPTLSKIAEADAWAREEAARIILN